MDCERSGPRAERNPWRAATLEWTTDAPPPHSNWRDAPIVDRWPYDYSVPGAAEDYMPQTVQAIPGADPGEA